MKEVIAVVRMNMMNQNKKALTEAGIAAFFAHEVLGRGKGLVNDLVLEGAKAGHEEAVALLGEKGKLYPKRLISVVVPDKEVPALVKTLIAVNQTGQPGDGKIFVMPVDNAVRVRTGEKGPKAIA
ncbi:MAG: P-II family nitrogen regulator [Desulfarculus sp.]|nr:P-II family nitrogen regulator [Desulfarculus sp.]